MQSNYDRAVRPRPDVENIAETETVNNDAPYLRSYNQRFHLVPQDFNFPTCSAQMMWTQWHLGNAALRIFPLRRLRSEFRSDITSNKRHLIDKAGLVIDTVVRIARDKGFLPAGVEVNSTNCWDIWNAAFPEYIKHIFSEEQRAKQSFRVNDIYYTTLHKNHTRLVDGIQQFEKAILRLSTMTIVSR